MFSTLINIYTEKCCVYNLCLLHSHDILTCVWCLCSRSKSVL